jgi:hypothetical protein
LKRHFLKNERQLEKRHIRLRFWKSLVLPWRTPILMGISSTNDEAWPVRQRGVPQRAQAILIVGRTNLNRFLSPTSQN